MNLWDKKPKAWSFRAGGRGVVALYYDADEMDAWLKQLKEQEDALRELNHNQFQAIGGLEKEIRCLHRSARNENEV